MRRILISTITTLLISGSYVAHCNAQSTNEPTICLAPCYFDTNTGQTHCPCTDNDLQITIVDPPPACLAPCYFDTQTGNSVCPCDGVNQVVTPEPMSLILLGGGLLGGAVLRKRKQA